MNVTKTDREQSLISDEFLWDTSSSTEVHKYVYPILDKWINNSETNNLLDLGCGNGSLTAMFANNGIKCYGTDFSESGIKIAQKAFPDVDFFQSSIDNELPINHHAKYDVVISVEVIEHLLLPRQLFNRAKEALKPDGYLIVTTPFHGFWKNIALALTNSFDKHWHPLRDHGHVKFFSESTLSQLFVEQGYEVIEIKRVGRIPIFARSMVIKGRLKK
jgi:2-polyprenyl-3-methyl-5-hydroxy-6-metoxy-1,4-benzoquinol methylase